MRRGGWWGSAASLVWPCCCWLCRGTRRGRADTGVLAQPRGPAGCPVAVGWVAPTSPPCCRWSFSGSRWELARGWCPERLSWGWHGGVTPETGQAGQGGGTGGRTSGTSTSRPVLGSQQESSPGEDLLLTGNVPVPMGGSGLPAISAHTRHGCHSQTGSPKHLQAARGCPLLTSPPTVSSAERKRRRWLRWWRTSSQQSLSWQDKRHVRGREWGPGPDACLHPARGWPPTSPTPIQPRHPPLFLAIQR